MKTDAIFCAFMHFTSNVKFLGQAVAQAVIHQLPTTAARV
jgi:hypothetical protein